MKMICLETVLRNLIAMKINWLQWVTVTFHKLLRKLAHAIHSNFFIVKMIILLKNFDIFLFLLKTEIVGTY